MSKNKKLSYIANFVLVIALYGVLFYLISAGIFNRYLSGIITMVFINIILTVSLNLASGFLGQLVLGHAGFMSVGAYSAALFSMYSGLPNAIALPIGLLLGGLVAAVFSVIIGIPALRLRGDYLAIITLGFGEIIRVLILAFDFTGGAKGLRGIPTFVERGKGNNDLVKFSYVFFLAVVTVYVIYSFIRSRHGRAVIAIREDEIAAEASGINTTYYKLLAFILAAFFAGVAGGLYAHHIGVLAPAKFNFNYSVEILVMVVLGGMGSITGSVISATVLTILPELLREFSDYRMLAYSIILIIVMLFRPTGLMGQYEISLRKFVEKIFDKRKSKKAEKPQNGEDGKEA
ncbi:MAG: branched-chain amino acid ABC transporter permease [Oscillospiraceae bacterium]